MLEIPPVKRTSLRLLPVVALGAAMIGSHAGCKPDSADCEGAACTTPPATTDVDADEGVAEDGSDVNNAESDAQLLTTSLVSSSATGVGLASASDLEGGELTPADLGDGVRAIYFPRGCLAVTSDTAAKTATYTFGVGGRGCSGPRGLFNITGEVKVKYSATESALHLDVVATKLTINRATVDWTASADVTADGVKRTMTWKAQLSGATARERNFGRTTDSKIEWSIGEPCLGLSGTSVGDVRGRSIRVDVSNFRRCRGGCPEAGGVIAITNVAKGTRVEVRYDGTDRATLVASDGRSAEVGLLCRSN